MHRQHSRNQRNRGIKVKHVLQICLFLAISFWLIYQMKHSHDKKDDYEEDDGRDSMDRGSIGGYIKIGRKDIRPLYDEDRLQNEASEEGITEVENNHEEDRSLDMDFEEENEASRYEDVVEKFDTEVDQEEGEVSDEAREVGSKKSETSVDVNGRKRENSDKRNHEALEEIHEVDDGSRRVSHVNFIRTAENKKEVVGISDQHQKNIVDLENKDTHSEEPKNGETSEEDNPSSALSVTTDSLDKGSSQNNTLTETPNSNMEASNNTTDVTPQNPESLEQSVTKSVPELDHGRGIISEGKSIVGSIFKIISLHQNSSTSTVENHLPESHSAGQTEPKNSEADFEDFLKPYNDADSLPIVRMRRSEHSFEDETNSRKNETASHKSDSAKTWDAVA